MWHLVGKKHLDIDLNIRINLQSSTLSITLSFLFCPKTMKKILNSPEVFLRQSILSNKFKGFDCWIGVNFRNYLINFNCLRT